MFDENPITMTVRRVSLLETLKTNLAKHESTHEEAVAGYIEAAEKALKTKLKEIKQGKATALHFSLTPPQNMSREYKTVISMLEMSESETVTLTQSQFEQLILDRWNWKMNWLASNAGYSSTARLEVASMQS